jgi:hypothetical protein
MKIRRVTAPVVLGTAVVFFSAAAFAQDPQTRTGVPVQITVSVEAKKGTEIPPITKHDVVVHQGKSVRPVTAWVPAKGNDAGLALAVLIDDSASASFGTQMNDLRNFIQERAPTTQVAVGYMANGTVSLTHNFTLDHGAAAKTVRLTQGYFGVEASPYLSLSDFIKRWTSSPTVQRREVLMITSGIDTVYGGGFPDPYVDAAVRDAQCAGVVVYAIYTPSAGHFGRAYWLTYWGQNYLAELAEETGGESYYFMGLQPPVAFAPYLNEFSQQLQNQFLLTFLAEPRKKTGRQPVKITSENHSIDFAYATQVCVPAATEQ